MDPNQGVRRLLAEIMASKLQFKDKYPAVGRDLRERDQHFKSPPKKSVRYLKLGKINVVC